MKTLVDIIDEAVIYCPEGNDLDIIIDGYSTDDRILRGHDDDGNEYEIPFDEIDLDTDSFFAYQKIN